ncbi:MAG: CheR family methyltransferase [Acidimicrobiia bacterium]
MSGSSTPDTVVGIGASAGGLDALKRLLPALPDVTGIAYVVVVHLSPEHESHLAELLQPHCRLPVTQVQHTVDLQADHVYVIPPGCYLEAAEGVLQLVTGVDGGRLRAPIDHFLHTLGAVHDGRSVAVVLTGTGSDGTLGLGAVQSCGGVTIVQEPAEAEFDGMPRTAISAGAADQVLRLEQIAPAIEALHRSHPRLRTDEAEEPEQELLARVLLHVSTRTGQDLQGYKPATILRRIGRRMQLRQIVEPEAYLDVLRQDEHEVEQLFQDLLISVTRFFRDPEVFEALARDVLPDVVASKPPDRAVRAWSAGCATGEEAYSLAMVLVEALDGLARPPGVQVFATDLSPQVLQRAREGSYPDTIEDHVSAERLRRFFVRQDGTYRVGRSLREMVVFAPHNLLQDPPFSHVDIVLCRNLLIYLQPPSQRRAIEVFHYALEPGGHLVLGPAETVDGTDLFLPVDVGSRTYRRRQRAAMEPGVLAIAPTDARPPARPGTPMTTRIDRSFGALHEQVVERYAPPSVLCSLDGTVLHSSATAGRYLVHPGGDPTSDLLSLARLELRPDLRSGLQSARDLGRPTRSRPVHLTIDGAGTTVVVRVHPTAPDDDGARLLLVIFDEIQPEVDDVDHEVPADHVTVQFLERELTATRRRLRSVIEEYEAAQEEMRASNEEMQSTNEELRSTLEELETSKEELQSMNEELITLNQENRHKVDELGQLSSDLQNLLISTDIATLFLDRSFRILRFTPRVTEVFNVRLTDRGRPLSDLTHRLGSEDLVDDAEQVLARLVPVEREVESDDGRWFLTRVVPYRTADDRIEGVVVTFIDITKRRQAEIELRELNEQLEQRVAQQTHDVRTLASNLSMAEHDVRRRISQLLHDDLQQRLHALQMRTGLAAEHAERGDVDGAARLIAEVEAGIAEAIDVTRGLSVDLSPPILATEGLEQALGWLANQMREMHGLQVDVGADAVPVLTDDLRVFLFQVVRELLFNVVKHARVDRAEVRVESRPDQVTVVVSDSGRGFDVGAVLSDGARAGHLGLPGVRERLSLLGGRLEVDSGRGRGTRMRVVLPLGGEEKPT